MLITHQLVAKQIEAYLRDRISSSQLVDWAEHQVMDGEFESPVVHEIIARLGLADVRAFGLTWEDCQRMLRELGFEAQVQIAAVTK